MDIDITDFIEANGSEKLGIFIEAVRSAGTATGDERENLAALFELLGGDITNFVNVADEKLTVEYLRALATTNGEQARYLEENAQQWQEYSRVLSQAVLPVLASIAESIASIIGLQSQFETITLPDGTRVSTGPGSRPGTNFRTTFRTTPLQDQSTPGFTGSRIGIPPGETAEEQARRREELFANFAENAQQRVRETVVMLDGEVVATGSNRQQDRTSRRNVHRIAR